MGRSPLPIPISSKKDKSPVPGKKPSKKELARMKAMNELGESPTSIAARMDRSHNTVVEVFEAATFTTTRHSVRWSKRSKRKS